MPFTLQQDAKAVILPAFADTALSDDTKKFLDEGGVSILLGESREEYVSRTMTDQRRAKETPETFSKVTAEARARAGSLLVLVDQEIGGICRLHDLVPSFPPVSEIHKSSDDEIQNIANEIATLAVGMGVNGFLAPILDLITGVNPWLEGRTYSTDPDVVGRISSAYVRGVQAAGVAATAKHFPGFHNISRDPAIHADAINVEAKQSFEPGLRPFKDVIRNAVEIVMVGPAIVQAFDADVAALRSKTVVDMLKTDLGFSGVVLADDLDAKATMRDDSVEQVALDALNAGCDFLLLPDMDGQLESVTSAIVDGAQKGTISRERLATSASKVRALATKYATDA